VVGLSITLFPKELQNEQVVTFVDYLAVLGGATITPSRIKTSISAAV